MYEITSWTVLIFSASSSEISISYSSSKAITSSTISNESAPRSSMKDASGTTSSSLTPNCSHTISFTLACTDDAIFVFLPAYSPFLLHVKSAINIHHLTGDIGRSRSCEEDHQMRHFFTTTEPAQGNRAKKLLLELGR